MEGLENATTLEVPTTPNTIVQRTENASPEVATLQPQPRRAFPAGIKSGQPAVAPSSPWSDTPWSGGGDTGPSRDLHEFWNSTGDTKQAAPATLEQGGVRPLSSVSTSAGMTPSPDGRPRSAQDASRGAGASPALTQTPYAQAAGMQRTMPSPVKEAPGAPSQSRKIFVGGIPQ